MASTPSAPLLVAPRPRPSSSVSGTALPSIPPEHGCEFKAAGIAASRAWGVVARVDQAFGVSTKGSSVSTEVWAGVSVFFVSSYLLQQVPALLAQAGMDETASFGATALTSGVGAIVMGFVSNTPIVVGPSVSFARDLGPVYVDTLKCAWEDVLGTSMLSGLLLAVVWLTVPRKLIVALPEHLRIAIGVGTGFVIGTDGIQIAGLLRGSGSANDKYLPMFLLGAMLVVVLMHWKLRHAVVTTMVVVSALCFVENWALGKAHVEAWGVPDVAPVLAKPSLVVAKDFPWGFLMLLGYLCLNRVFHVIAVMITIMEHTFVPGDKYEAGHFRRILNSWDRVHHTLVADALVSALGCVFGIPYTLCRLESCVGVAMGGKTGLVAVVTGTCFLLSFFLRPLVLLLSPQAQGAVLLTGSFVFCRSIRHIDFDNVLEGMPAMACVVCMAAATDMSLGPSFAFLSLTVTALVNRDRSHLTATNCVLTFFSVLLTSLVVLRDSSMADKYDHM